MNRFRMAIPAALLALLAVACGDDNKVVQPPPGQAAPDFSLTDVNPNSPRNGQAVSPRDYLQQVSAWYFGHAT